MYLRRIETRTLTNADMSLCEYVIASGELSEIDALNLIGEGTDIARFLLIMSQK